MNERYEAIRKARRSGRTFKSIAEEYGLSKERVRQIYLKAERINQRLNSDDLCKAMLKLSGGTRIYNALMREGIDSLEKLRTYTIDELLKVRALGEKSIDELIMEGYVTLPEEIEETRYVITDNGIVIKEYYLNEKTEKNRG